MLGTFLIPFRHLSLNHARIDPVPPQLRPLPLQLPEQAFIPRLERCGRLAVAFRKPAFQDLETPGERQPGMGPCDWDLGVRPSFKLT